MLQLMPDNMPKININNALPIPKLEVKLNTCDDNTSLSKFIYLYFILHFYFLFDDEIILGILLTWTHNQENYIESYEVYYYALIKDDTIHNPWKLLGKLAALPLPMTVLLKLVC